MDYFPKPSPLTSDNQPSCSTLQKQKKSEDEVDFTPAVDLTNDDDEVVPTNKDQVKSKNLQLPVGPGANTETNGHLGKLR